jgi:hypothetical protein
MGHQANTATQAIARADGRLPDVLVEAGRKGFEAELVDCASACASWGWVMTRSRMRSRGHSTQTGG